MLILNLQSLSLCMLQFFCNFNFQFLQKRLSCPNKACACIDMENFLDVQLNILQTVNETKCDVSKYSE